ncbi:hypothetical protein B7494_g7483 [Chlorociboria aeruginascens]|nr:hypothetical protein B7494_g7483 [Chlorociboria aeruginascens]
MEGVPCADCFSGTLHTDDPTGTTTTIHGLKTYVAQPDAGVTPKGIVVIITDGFGWEFPNNRVLADRYAQRGGFLVYLPDFMNGNALDSSILALMDKLQAPSSWLTTLLYKPFWIAQAASLLVPWLIRTREAVSKPKIFDYFTALRTSAPPFPSSDLKIGAAGFCWGGKYTVLLAANPPSSRVVRHGSATNAIEPLIDCGFTAHPSGLNMPKDIEAVILPLSVSVGNEDMAMKGEMILKMKEILEVKKKGDHEVIIFPGAKHGFAVRLDPKDKYQAECAAKAEVQAIEWFTRWFA